MKKEINLREAARIGAAFDASLGRARILLSPAAGAAVAGTLALAAESLGAAALNLDDLVRDKPDIAGCERLGRAYVKTLRNCLESARDSLDDAIAGTLEEILCRAEESVELVAVAVPLYRYIYDDRDEGPAFP